jgi:hypothetical protein
MTQFDPDRTAAAPNSIGLRKSGTLTALSGNDWPETEHRAS